MEIKNLYGQSSGNDWSLGSVKFWEETGRVVVDYINLRLDHSDNPYGATVADFIYWLKRRESRMLRYESDDIARSEIIDEWLLSAGVRRLA